MWNPTHFNLLKGDNASVRRAVLHDKALRGNEMYLSPRKNHLQSLPGQLFHVSECTWAVQLKIVRRFLTVYNTRSLLHWRTGHLLRLPYFIHFTPALLSKVGSIGRTQGYLHYAVF